MKTFKNRKPLETEKGVLIDYPAVQTPWGKLISFKDTYRYALRHNASVAATFMQVLRIVVPDYEERSNAICEVNRPTYYKNYSIPAFQDVTRDTKYVHPFVRGGYANAPEADHGDEALWMCGRVNDYGTFRTEKELDTCPWDIVGSEYCRCTTNYTQGMNQAWTDAVPGSESLDYNMVEARGCGDRHCRLIGESRKKYPIPGTENKPGWDCFGPIATDDLRKVTSEENCYTDPQQMRPECDYLYHSPFDATFTAAEMYEAMAALPLGSNSIIPTLYAMEKDETKIENVTKCVFEAAGKAAFAEFSSIKGMRDLLGVPGDLNDGRVMGGVIELVLQSLLLDYEIVSFDEKGAVYDINRWALQREMPLLTKAYIWMWHGMVKTLVSADWSVWEDKNEVEEGTLRIRVQKKIDKFM